MVTNDVVSGWWIVTAPWSTWVMWLTFILFVIVVSASFTYVKGYQRGLQEPTMSRNVARMAQNISQKQKTPRLPPHLKNGRGYVHVGTSEPVVLTGDDANIYFAECPFCSTPMATGMQKCEKCGKWTWEDMGEG